MFSLYKVWPKLLSSDMCDEIVECAPIDSKYLTIQYERLVPLLIEAIKEMSYEISTLKKQINSKNRKR